MGGLTLENECIIVGGDIGSYQNNVLAATAFGIMPKENILYRSGAKENDILCVSGDIGLPFTALMYFENAKQKGLNLSKYEEQILLNSWKRPQPRIKCGTFLSKHKLANSCQDVSDGLKASIEQISKASDINFTINEDDIILNPIIYKVATYLNVSPLSMALSASVDFSLLFTVHPDKIDRVIELFSNNNIDLKIIGKANQTDKCKLKYKDNSLGDIPGLKWDHKSGDIIEQFMESK